MRIIGILAIISLGILGLILTQTSPSTITPIGILFVFLLMYISMLGMMTYFLYLGSQWLAGIIRIFRAHEVKRLSVRQSYIFGSVLAIGPVIILAMQSVARLSLVDALLVIVFEALLLFYVWRRI